MAHGEDGPTPRLVISFRTHTRPPSAHATRHDARAKSTPVFLHMRAKTPAVDPSVRSVTAGYSPPFMGRWRLRDDDDGAPVPAWAALKRTFTCAGREVNDGPMSGIDGVRVHRHSITGRYPNPARRSCSLVSADEGGIPRSSSVRPGSSTIMRLFDVRRESSVVICRFIAPAWSYREGAAG
jgi:hypothetical protein